MGLLQEKLARASITESLWPLQRYCGFFNLASNSASIILSLWLFLFLVTQLN